MMAITQRLDTFSSLISRTYRWVRRLFWGGLIVAGCLMLLELIHLAELLAAVHPLLAWAVMLLLALPLLGWSGWRVYRFLRTPRVLQPPDLPDVSLGWSATDRQRYLQFAVLYLRRQSGNPHLSEDARALIPAAILKLEAMVPADESADPVRGTAELTGLVERLVAEVLAPLDTEANRLIRRAAVEVSCATAVSPSVLLDGLITLTRNLDLMSRLADLYYGRPGMRGVLRIMRDVLGSAVAAGALELISDNVTGALTEMTGSWTTRLLGPIGQGMVNGVVTMRIGAATRKRCRSLSSAKVSWLPWQVSQYKQAFRKLYEWLGAEAGPAVRKPFASWLDWMGTAAQSTVKQGWLGKIFNRSQPEEQPEQDNSPAQQIDDALLESGLLD
jgi:hypothetical protein